MAMFRKPEKPNTLYDWTIITLLLPVLGVVEAIRWVGGWRLAALVATSL